MPARPIRLPVRALLLLAACAQTIPETPVLRLQYVTSAPQFGPVSFRDPLGALSPDGQWLAYSVQQRLFLQPVPAGALISPSGQDGIIVHLTWTTDSLASKVVMDRRGAAPRWWSYDPKTGVEAPLWRQPLRLRVQRESGGPLEVSTDSLRQLTWSPDGSRIAGMRQLSGGTELWTFGPNGEKPEVTHSAEKLSYPVFAPAGGLACLSYDETIQIISSPCGDAEEGATDVEAYGPLAISPDGETLYYAAPDSLAALALFAAPASVNLVSQLTTFARDAYAPSVARDGALLFKVQDYRTVVGVVPAGGGAVRALSSFQSETPSWDPTGKWIGVTYGTWRRVSDDFHYPDIAQDLGLISADPAAPAREPAQYLENSASEDQSLSWSPNGRWIAFHSHRDQGDDIWVVPADQSAPARRLTSFGRGAETGWPRWSPDGRWLAFDASAKGPRPARSVVYVLGMDQQRGLVTSPERVVALQGFSGDAVHAEWLPGSDRLAILGEEGPGQSVILVAPRDGGAARVVHRWQSEHRFAGLGVSPDGSWAAFIAPAAGRFQLFRIPLGGGAPEQLTFDPSNKSQPAYSPDGRRIALTLWTYDVQFWILREPFRGFSAAPPVSPEIRRPSTPEVLEPEPPEPL